VANGDGKGNYLALVTLGIHPQKVIHGNGHDAQQARNDAAQTALKVLYLFGTVGYCSHGLL